MCFFLSSCQHKTQNPLIRDRQICPSFTKAQPEAPPGIKQALKACNACRTEERMEKKWNIDFFPILNCC